MKNKGRINTFKVLIHLFNFSCICNPLDLEYISSTSFWLLLKCNLHIKQAFLGSLIQNANSTKSYPLSLLYFFIAYYFYLSCYTLYDLSFILFIIHDEYNLCTGKGIIFRPVWFTVVSLEARMCPVSDTECILLKPVNEFVYLFYHSILGIHLFI